MEGVKILKIFYRNFFLRGVLGGFLGDFFGGLGCENIGLIDKDVKLASQEIEPFFTTKNIN